MIKNAEFWDKIAKVAEEKMTAGPVPSRVLIDPRRTRFVEGRETKMDRVLDGKTVRAISSALASASAGFQDALYTGFGVPEIGIISGVVSAGAGAAAATTPKRKYETFSSTLGGMAGGSAGYAGLRAIGTSNWGKRIFNSIPEKLQIPVAVLSIMAASTGGAIGGRAIADAALGKEED